MSRESRRSLREKSISRRVLERSACEEIDEFVNAVVEPIETYEDAGPDEDLDDIFGSIPEDDWYDAYEDEEDWGDDYDYSLDDRDYDYWDIGGPDTYGGEIGRYYKDMENRTYLCCRVHGVTVYVNILTGRECAANPFHLEKVG